MKAQEATSIKVYLNNHLVDGPVATGYVNLEECRVLSLSVYE